MTIGIAATGPDAGIAVYRALASVERIARGAIGGYAVFAAIDAEGTVHRGATQRGGTQTLFTDGETTGVAPPRAAASAPIAGIMSSGPDRPEPLDQFVPAHSGAGLVTGHRLPNAPGPSGTALNVEVLDRLAAGRSPQRAVDAVLNADPEADAGMIAVDTAGGIYGANSARVARRPDLGHVRRSNPAGNAIVEVLHNGMYPIASIAELAASIALDIMHPPVQTDGYITVNADTPVVAGNTARVIVDPEGQALRIESTDQRILTGWHNCAAIYLNAEVVRENTRVGWTTVEPNAVVSDGRIVTLSGQSSIRIGYHAVRGQAG